MNSLKTSLRKTFLYSAWRFAKKYQENKKDRLHQTKLVEEWKKNGKPLPPPQLHKRLIIKKYASENGIKVFVETGTYMGDTLDYFKNFFRKLISIELDQKLYLLARQKFSKKKQIEIYQGDSGEVLQRIIANISEPCLFWLDGHYSEGITAKGKLNTPILSELDHIFSHDLDKHVVLIDDARCFTGEDDYPTIDFLKNYVKQKNKLLKFTVEDDIIRIHR